MASPFTGGLAFWDSHIQQNEDLSEGSTRRFLFPSGLNFSAAAGKPGAAAAGAAAAAANGILSELPKPRPSSLSLEERFQLCLKVAEECVQPDELLQLLARKNCPTAYDGFEPSGRMHLAQGLLKVHAVNRLTAAGCRFVFWVADWFAGLNNKLGGDSEKIRKVGEYFVEVWKSAGMQMQNVQFLWASEEIGKDPETYWNLVMNIAKANSISRIKRCSQIMGRTEGDDQPAAQILYPCMQCADIFYLNADICQLGMDQRKVNMLAREYCDEVKRKHKPVILSHPMLPGLLEGQEKMSKSNADSAIFMEDSEAEVNRKIKKAFCPPAQVHGNPCVAYVERLVFPDKEFHVQRTLENGGNIVFKTAEEFKRSFAAGELHPADLKAALAREINRQLEPVRRHFQTDENAKKLLQEISKYKITR
ncbi:tyrosyl-tRNA synthetase, putative [Eimeria tenella]|uniref:tyrosine--tRNA ligase n=1 Tax=Eimeria tenella TaxID=5802 RepID=U6KNU0_EIMTE|nr:tyrosyl-tRNA synthetase, putative [Eimeria tenella]CDJ39646.1 tyrosyl-tRNA synthetase, putative [Eimeria tenella]|eukprot:XP_013230401.1 tyrosyl-tRNA synthetase, putative [Eimeria tenella]